MVKLRSAIMRTLLPLTSLLLPSVIADSAGSYLWDPPINNEGNAYARVIQLQHSGNANGKLLATWEHWYTAGPHEKQTNNSASNFIIRESNDLGATWTTLATVHDPQTGPGHPSPYFYQPFLFEFPQQLGKYPEGTLLLVGNLFNGTNTEFFSWRSTDHGQKWDPVGGWQYGGTTNASGIWEPFLFVDSQDRLIAVFSDERDGLNHSQMLVHVVSEDGGDTWSKNVTRDVVGAEQKWRPGMATVAKMDNGEYLMSYEWCDHPFHSDPCPVHFKTSQDGVTWNASDPGKVISSPDGIQPFASPYTVWDSSAKQLIMSSRTVRYVSTSTGGLAPESQRVVFVNTDHGNGDWSWAPSPWNASNSSTNCSSNYSPNLLVLSDGTIRYTTATALTPEGLCSERTGAAPIGILPYRSNFSTNGQAGWIDFGGSWSISNGQYGFASVTDPAAIAVTGSSGWTDYNISANVIITSSSGVIGLSTRVSASSSAPNALTRYTAAIDSNSGNLTLYRVADTTSVLHSVAHPGGIHTNKQYHLSFSVNSTSLQASLTEDQEGSSTMLTSSDDSLKQGMTGLFGSYGSGGFKNVQIEDLS
ncbi:predicted protein [Paecilomyces variotii No. 5]|uniref:Sialidase domain-containing protein n=1 Tax=Byssochlamys spectabilis (strain No. 5 / NBRC 109023) TaxID=1356009 RepID=V5HW98_BYSSN|nr:predicted protein [Paecilomyces variotii No. 5]